MFSLIYLVPQCTNTVWMLFYLLNVDYGCQTTLLAIIIICWWSHNTNNNLLFGGGYGFFWGGGKEYKKDNEEQWDVIETRNDIHLLQKKGNSIRLEWITTNITLMLLFVSLTSNISFGVWFVWNLFSCLFGRFYKTPLSVLFPTVCLPVSNLNMSLIARQSFSPWQVPKP